MKKILFLIIFSTSYAFGQSAQDALIFSKENIEGSARFSAMGSAFTSIGGDLSAMGINPASGAVFNFSNSGFSWSNNSTNHNVKFYNGYDSNQREYGNFNQGGMVFVFRPEGSAVYNKIALGFNYDRTSNYNEDLHFSGNNSTQVDVYNGSNLVYSGYSTLAASFALASNSMTPNELYLSEGLAFDSFLTDINDPNSKYYNANYPDYSDANPVYVTPVVANNSLQDYSQKGFGRTGRYNFSISGEINNSLYIGAAYNRYDLNYTREITHRESNFDASSDIENFTYESYLNTLGTGYSFSIGTIVKLSEVLRVGAAYHSPTYFRLNDLYDVTISTEFKTPDNNGNYSYMEYSGPMSFEYKLRSPEKFNLGFSIVLPKSAVLSFDYERIGYNNMQLSPSADFRFENLDIANTFKATNNYKFGSEWNISFLALRLGYNFIESPYKDEFYYSNTHLGSGGIGINFMKWSLDIAYVRTLNDSKLYLYEKELIDAAQIESTRNRFSIGFRYSL